MKYSKVSFILLYRIVKWIKSNRIELHEIKFNNVEFNINEIDDQKGNEKVIWVTLYEKKYNVI